MSSHSLHYSHQSLCSDLLLNFVHPITLTMLDTKGTSALEGKLIIDLSRVLGGPYCSQILGDHGAEVIKIEPPRGDETRDWGPPFHDEDSAYFIE